MNSQTIIKPRVILISIIPNLMGGEGHIIPYHTSVGEAANLLHWQHIVSVPPDPNIVNLPDNWHTCLSPENMEAKVNPMLRIWRFKNIINLSVTIAKSLKKLNLSDVDYPIIFLERFIHVQLFALLIALQLIPKKNISVWLLYRRDTHKDKTFWIYHLLNKTIKKTLESGKLHLLTDSQLLSNSLSKYFHETVTVMPIPHTDFINIDNNYHPTHEIICWWVGVPRWEKGWNIIKSLVNSVSHQAEKLCLIAAESSGFSQQIGGIKVKLISNNLTKLEYSNWLKNSHVILLPYDAEAYSERTSGVFTECIMAGKIPVVTKGTWMAQELSRYNLEELIIDWNYPEIIVDKIIQFSQSLILREKLKQIQQAYQNFHTVESYADQMQKLFSISDNR